MLRTKETTSVRWKTNETEPLQTAEGDTGRYTISQTRLQ